MVDLDVEAKKKRGQELAEIKGTLMSAYQAKEKVFVAQEVNKQLEKDLVDIGVE